MTYFQDLSPYRYFHDDLYGCKNVGWLDPAYPFPTAPPDPAFLAKLWEFCKVSVHQTRGWHLCPFCPAAESIIRAERNGEHLRLGTSEIRVFSLDDRTPYAAPTLIYHYVEAHLYAPPEEFVRAVLEGASPNDRKYLEALAKCGLEWDETSSLPIGK